LGIAFSSVAVSVTLFISFSDAADPTPLFVIPRGYRFFNDDRA